MFSWTLYISFASCVPRLLDVLWSLFLLYLWNKICLNQLDNVVLRKFSLWKFICRKVCIFRFRHRGATHSWFLFLFLYSVIISWQHLTAFKSTVTRKPCTFYEGTRTMIDQYRTTYPAIGASGEKLDPPHMWNDRVAYSLRFLRWRLLLERRK